MIVVMALAVATLFGAGMILVLSRDLFRVVAGVILVSNAINLFLVSASRGPYATQLDVLATEVHADPLAQALALTAIVITFGVTALLLGLVLRVYATHGSIGMEAIAGAERREEEEIEKEREAI